MTPTQRRDGLAALALDLHDRITAAVAADYPGLRRYALGLPKHKIVRYGPGEDDWRWGDYTVRDHIAAYHRYMSSAVGAASERISEVYGLGAGPEWAHRHFAAHCASEVRATAQVIASLDALRRI